MSARKCFVAATDHELNDPISPTLRDDQNAAARPASTGTTGPLMQLDSLLARNTTAWAFSVDSAARRKYHELYSAVEQRDSAFTGNPPYSIPPYSSVQRR